MATTLIRNGCVSGALAGMMAGKVQGSFTTTDYATLATIADTIGAECITRNTALTAPMADADNAQIGQLCQATAFAACFQQGSVSVTAADYLALANQIVASAKAAVSKLV